MIHTKRVSLLAGSAALIVSGVLWGTGAARAFDLSAPTVRGNLAVYFVHGTQNAALPMATFEDAFRDGNATITDTGHGLQVQNFGGTPLLVPFGTLLRGGSQDQVVAATEIIPPGSTRAIDTYCVDPFRSSERSGESSDFFTSAHSITPSHSQKLNLLAGEGFSGPVTRLRQAGVWWGIDTLRAQLAQQTGASLASRLPAHWSHSSDELPGTLMRDRTENWKDSLPLTLDDGRLAQLERPILSALTKPPELTRDVVGVAVAVDGHWVGAEVFQSHQLFERLWPSILRGYVVESIAERSGTPSVPPTAAAMKALMVAAQGEDEADQHNGTMLIHDSGSALVTAASDSHGRAVAMSFVPKLDPASAALTPDGMFVQMLDSGKIEGRAITTLTAAPILAKDASGTRWSVSEYPEHVDRLPTVDTTDDSLSFIDMGVLGLMVAFGVWVGLRATPLGRTRAGAALDRGFVVAAALPGRAVATLARFAAWPFVKTWNVLRHARISSPIAVLAALARRVGWSAGARRYAR